MRDIFVNDVYKENCHPSRQNYLDIPKDWQIKFELEALSREDWLFASAHNPGFQAEIFQAIGESEML